MGCSGSRQLPPLRLATQPQPGTVSDSYLDWVRVGPGHGMREMTLASRLMTAVAVGNTDPGRPENSFGVVRRRFADGSARIGRVFLSNNKARSAGFFAEGGAEVKHSWYEMAYIKNQSTELTWAPFTLGAPPAPGAIVSGEIIVGFPKITQALFVGMVVITDAAGTRHSIPGTLSAAGCVITLQSKPVLVNKGEIYILCAPPRFAAPGRQPQHQQQPHPPTPGVSSLAQRQQQQQQQHQRNQPKGREDQNH